MKRLNLCIDIDGTVTDAYYWLKRANGYFNKNVTPEDVIYYEIHRVMGIEDHEHQRFYDLLCELLHWEAEIRPGAQVVINRLFHQHHVHFVTAREERMRKVSLDWFEKYKIPMDSISLLGSHNKVKKAAELDCDLFIEDRYDNAVQLAQAGYDVLLIDCNYNRGLLPDNVTRVSNWNQIEAIIDDIDHRLGFKIAL
jgi:uncharacterized HAD superfamily protein